MQHHRQISLTYDTIYNPTVLGKCCILKRKATEGLHRSSIQYIVFFALFKQLTAHHSPPHILHLSEIQQGTDRATLSR